MKIAVIIVVSVYCQAYVHVLMDGLEIIAVQVCKQYRNVFQYVVPLYFISDINECNTLNGGCDGSCHNSLGSFSCSCGNGYTLDSDGKTCNGIEFFQ